MKSMRKFKMVAGLPPATVEGSASVSSENGTDGCDAPLWIGEETVYNFPLSFGGIAKRRMQTCTTKETQECGFHFCG